eukprot:4110338-Alexandrium_andersonii.AAC.2
MQHEHTVHSDSDTCQEGDSLISLTADRPHGVATHSSKCTREGTESTQATCRRLRRPTRRTPCRTPRRVTSDLCVTACVVINKPWDLADMKSQHEDSMAIKM